MRVLIAPDSFKTVLDARGVAECIAEGVRRGRPDAEIVLVPMADGGEGTLDVLVDAARGNRRRVNAHGPRGAPLEVTVGLINQAATAVVELALVSGYGLITPEQRDPLRTTTHGLGEVLRAIIETEMEDVILALGGSATVDGGAGMMQALGLSLLDEAGRTITDPISGGKLREIHRMVWDRPQEGLENVRFTIACDVLNPACGPSGAAAVFGPQKGADARGVKILEEGLQRWASLLETSCGHSIRNEPGTGAAGGVALPLLAMTNAMIIPGVDLVCESVGLAGAIGDADLVITGEGRIDRQSMMGKVVGAVGRMAQSADVSCVAICGVAGEGARSCLTVLDEFRTLDAPIERTQERLVEVGEQVANEML